jgi:hypothetical protein
MTLFQNLVIFAFLIVNAGNIYTHKDDDLK